jgi:hypothetical protein
MKILVHTTALLTLLSTTAGAQTNAGNLTPEASLPFTITQVASFNLPWRIAFLPDGRMLITEKVGPVWLVTQQGEKTPSPTFRRSSTRAARNAGVFLSPKYATDHNVYLTYAEPGEADRAWRSHARARARRGQGEPRRIAGAVARYAEGQGRPVRRPDRIFARRSVSLPHRRRAAAHDTGAGSEFRVGKILRLTLDGKPAPGNPMAGKTGARAFR